MDTEEVFSFDAELELTERLDERHAFDVTDGASQLHNTHFWYHVISIMADWLPRDTFNPLLDGVRYMRHHFQTKIRLLIFFTIQKEQQIFLTKKIRFSSFNNS